MNATERHALRETARRARAMAAEMDQFADQQAVARSAQRPRPERADLKDLARAVRESDQFMLREQLSTEQLAHILEIALKTRIGLMCMSHPHGRGQIDLGNGYVLTCEIDPRAW